MTPPAATSIAARSPSSFSMPQLGAESSPQKLHRRQRQHGELHRVRAASSSRNTAGSRQRGRSGDPLLQVGSRQELPVPEAGHRANGIRTGDDSSLHRLQERAVRVMSRGEVTMRCDQQSRRSRAGKPSLPVLARHAGRRCRRIRLPCPALAAHAAGNDRDRARRQHRSALCVGGRRPPAIWSRARSTSERSYAGAKSNLDSMMLSIKHLMQPYDATSLKLGVYFGARIDDGRSRHEGCVVVLVQRA